MQDTTLNKSSEAPDERKDLVINKNETRGETMDQITQVVPICTICTNNSAYPVTSAVQCYWKDHESLDIGNTCKYFDRGNTNIFFPVNDCFQLYLDSTVLLISPSYAVTYRNNEYTPYVGEGDKCFSGGLGTIHLYDARNDSIIANIHSDNFTLEDFLYNHPEIDFFWGTTDTMEQRYTAMAVAREIVAERRERWFIT